MATLDDINIDLSLVDGEEFPDPLIERSIFRNHSLESGECCSGPSQPSGLASLGGVAHDLVVTEIFFETVEGEMIHNPEAVETKREVKLTKERRVPCPARGMPPTHNAATAFLTLKPEVNHGDELTCSYPDCQKLGVKFRYCAMCKVPVSKRNFRSRHSHRKSVSGEEIAISSKVHAPLWAEKQKKNGRGRSVERAKGSAPSSVPLVVTTAGTGMGIGEEATESMIPFSAENRRRESAISASSMLMASMSSFTSIFDDDEDKDDGQKKGRHFRDQSIASIDSVELMKVIGGTEADEVHEASGSVHSSLFDGSFSNSNPLNPMTHFSRPMSSNAPNTFQNGKQVSPVHEKQPVKLFAQPKGSEPEVSCGQLKSSNPTMNVPTGQRIGNMFPNLSMSSIYNLSTRGSPPDLFQEFLHELREKRQVDVQCNASLTQKPHLSPDTSDRNKYAAQAINQSGLDHLLGNDDDVSIGSIDGSLSGIFDFTDSNPFNVVQPSTGNGFHPPTKIQQCTHQQTRHQPNNVLSLRNHTFENENVQPPSLSMRQGNNEVPMIQGNHHCRESIHASLGQGNIQTSMGQEFNQVLMSQVALDQVIAQIPNSATFGGCTSVGSEMINARVQSTSQVVPHQLINDPLIGNITRCLASTQPHFSPTNITNCETVGPTFNVPSFVTPGNVALNSNTNSVNSNIIPKQSTHRACEPELIDITRPRVGETNQSSAISKDVVAKKIEPKKRTTKKQDTLPEPENVTLVGMGFFSQLEEMGLKDVKGVTQTKKKKITRKRKPKPDLLKNVSMGFFSCQIEPEPEGKTKRRLVETNQLAPPQQSDGSSSMSALYNWAPAVDERARFAMEYSLPIVVPGVAILSKYSSYAFWYCLLLPVFHTLETMLTDFGPKASNYHLKCAFITPTMHLWMDLMLLHPICMAMFIWPSYYGAYAYHHGAVLLVLEFIYWAVAYKDIVNRKRYRMKTV
mmetsp:Transcript_21788/g.45820  ORF Transcript_21788/g.45820 Transcript_21788/m.45820 type:complete len:964 (-) Transcript_21788:155-3046(-)